MRTREPGARQYIMRDVCVTGDTDSARLVWNSLSDGYTPSTVSKGKVSIGCCDELHEEANAIRTSLIGQNQFTITDLRTHGDFSDRTPGTRPICKASHAVILL